MDNGMIALYGMVGFIFLILMVAAFIPQKASENSTEYRKKRMRVKSLKYRAR